MRTRHDSWSDEPTVRVPIPSQAEREAELLAQHDASMAQQFPEFAPSGRTYTLAEYQADLETTAHDMPALPELPDPDPSWGQVLCYAAEDAIKAVLP